MKLLDRLFRRKRPEPTGPSCADLEECERRWEEAKNEEEEKRELRQDLSFAEDTRRELEDWFKRQRRIRLREIE